jgi:phosphoglycerol transferase
MKKKKRKYRTKALSALLVLLIFAAIWLLLSAIWAFTTWSNLQMEEIVYELTAPLTGTGNDMITGYKLRCMLPAGIAALLSALFSSVCGKSTFNKKMAAIGVISALAPI